MEKVSVYKTSDGQTFDERSMAVSHQTELDLQEAGFDTEAMKANADVILAFLKPYKTVRPRKAE